MTTQTKTILSVSAIVVGVLLAILGWHFIDFIMTPPVGFQAAVPPSSSGVFAVITSFLGAAGLSGGGLVSLIINLIHPTNTTTGGGTNQSLPSTSSIALDLAVAMPAYFTDISNTAKAQRFWFDLLQMGIQYEPDPNIKSWLIQGVSIFSAKFFPPPIPVPIPIVPVPTPVPANATT